MPANNSPLPSSFDNAEFEEESGFGRLTRRMREEPLIPLGCLATCAALYAAQRSIKAGDKHRTNRMFRLRIAAQGFTIVAMMVGAKYWEGDRKKRKEFEDALKEKKATEKRDAWIKELEVRDQEEKDIQALRDKKRQARAAAMSSPADAKRKEEDSKKDDLEAEKKAKKAGVLEALAGLGKK